MTPWTQSLQIPISRCLCKRQEQKLLTHWSFCPPGSAIPPQSWCPHYKDSDTKVPCFIPNKPTARWLVYFLVFQFLLDQLVTLAIEIIFNIEREHLGVHTAWNQQVILFGRLVQSLSCVGTLCNPLDMAERLTLSLYQSLQKHKCMV